MIAEEKSEPTEPAPGTFVGVTALAKKAKWRREISGHESIERASERPLEATGTGGVNELSRGDAEASACLTDDESTGQPAAEPNSEPRYSDPGFFIGQIRWVNPKIGRLILQQWNGDAWITAPVVVVSEDDTAVPECLWNCLRNENNRVRKFEKRISRLAMRKAEEHLAHQRKHDQKPKQRGSSRRPPGGGNGNGNGRPQDDRQQGQPRQKVSLSSLVRGKAR